MGAGKWSQMEAGARSGARGPDGGGGQLESGVSGGTI